MKCIIFSALAFAAGALTNVIFAQNTENFAPPDSSQAVLDLTFNTDFAQADVDRAVNNLTRFNLFSPERRQFFLENSDVYAGADITNVKPFFSRTIGLADAQFNALPVPIDAGARFTDRNQNRTLAGLYARQRGSDGQASANSRVQYFISIIRSTKPGAGTPA